MEKQQTNNLLNFKELMAIGIGTVIGSGIVIVTGSAIAVTGRSVWISYALAVLLGMLCIIPYVILSSVLKLRGGDYSLASVLLGKRCAGVFIYNYIIMNIALALTAKASGIYLNSLFPNMNEKMVAIGVLSFFLVVNLFGINVMSKLQQIMTSIMLGTFAMFIVFGVMNLNTGAFDFSQPDYFLTGSSGVLSAMVMLVFSTTTVQTLISLGGSVQKPTVNIPKAIVTTMFIVFGFYVAIALVAGNVMEVSEVAGRPLTFVASQILPRPLFVLFIIGGPLEAIFTTINAMFSIASKPLKQATNDGWFPEIYGRNNRFGEPYFIMIGLYLVALIPILLDMDVSTITNNIVLIQYIVKFFLLFAVWNMPKKFPNQWKQSKVYMKKWVFNTIMGFILLVHVYIVWKAASNLTVGIVVLTSCFIGLATCIALLRERTGKVTMDVNPENYVCEIIDEN